MAFGVTFRTVGRWEVNLTPVWGYPGVKRIDFGMTGMYRTENLWEIAALEKMARQFPGMTVEADDDERKRGDDSVHYSSGSDGTIGHSRDTD